MGNFTGFTSYKTNKRGQGRSAEEIMQQERGNKAL